MVFTCWEEVYPIFTLQATPKIASDHWPVMLNTLKVNYSPIPSRFENMWVTHLQFKDCIQTWWMEGNVTGYEGFRFMKKLQHLKQRLRILNKNMFGDIKEIKDSIWKEVDIIDWEVRDEEHILPHVKAKKSKFLMDMECIIHQEEDIY